MKPRALEEVFADFRRTCDPAAMAEVFDRAAPELQLLARRLTRGRGEAEDLIQETFLAAIEHRESYDAARPLMPWLVGILVRQASSARRRSSREVDPSRLDATPPAAPGADVEAREFQGLVLDALSRLSPRDRSVLVPLLFDEQRAVQIARELGHRPDTIRMRIHRALERLRRGLPAGVSLQGFLPHGDLGRVREAVLGAARGARGPIPASAVPGALRPASLAPLVPGGAAGGWTAAWVALALVAVVALWWRLGPNEGERAAHPELEVAAQRAPATGEGAAGAAGAASDVPARRALEPAAAPAAAGPAARAWLNGSVRGPLAAELPAVAVTVHGLGPDPIARAETAVPLEDGSFRVDVTELIALGARRLLVRAELPSALPAEARVELGAPAAPPAGAHAAGGGSARDATSARPGAAHPASIAVSEEPGGELDAGVLELLPAHAIDGRVERADGAPAGGVAVALCALHAGAQDILPVDVGATAADGSFRLRARAAGRYAVIAHDPGARPATRAVDAAGATTEAGVLRLEQGLALAGVVRAPEGFPLAGTLVRCEAARTPGLRRIRFADSRFVRLGADFELATTLVACDERGRFDFRGLGAAPYELSVERLAGAGAVAGEPARRAGVEARAPKFDVALDVGWALVEFRLEPHPEARARPDELAIDVGCGGDDGRGAKPPARLRLDASGRARCQVAPGAAVRAWLHGARSAGRAELAFAAPPAGETRIVPLELAAGHSAPGARATLVLELAGVAHAPGETLGAGFFPRAAEPAREARGASAASEDPGELGLEPLFERRAVVDGARAELADLPPGQWRVRVRVGGSYARSFGFELPGELDVDLVAGTIERRTLRTELGGRARVAVRTSSGAQHHASARLFDAAGVELPVRFVALEPEAAREAPGLVVVDGSNELGPLRAGRYRLEFQAIWHEPVSLPFDVLPGRFTELALELRAR